MKSTAFRSIALLLSSALALLPTPVAALTEQPCGNQSPRGPSAPPCPGEGVNVFSAYTGNAHRDVLDISVFGSVGKMPLQFIRSSNTRLAPQSASQGRFGRDGVWTHNYQWYMRDAGTYSNGQPAMRVGYPDGGDVLFVRQADDNTLWLPPANTDERLFQNGPLFTLQKSTGELYQFSRLTNSTGGIFYRISNCEDNEGNLYTFTYSNATDTLLRKVSDSSGRYLAFTYVNLGQFDQQTVTLGTIPYGTGTAGSWKEITVTNATPCRFLSLYYSNDFHNAPPLPVGEIAFFDKNNQLITGTPFGSEPLAPDSSSPDAAFDGDISTYYRYFYMRNGYVGIDLGAGVSKTVGKILYFIPGSGTTAAAQFIGLNEAPSNNYVIKEVKSSDGRKVVYNYSIFTDPNPGAFFRWVNLDSVAYPDSVATVPDSYANYSYTQVADYSRPILSYASDPRIMGRGTKIAYEFDGDTSLGFIRKELDGVTYAEIAQTASISAHKPLALYPNGRVVKYEYNLTNANLSKVTDGLNRVTTMTYADGGAGHLATRTDPKSRTSSFTSTPTGAPIYASYPDGRVETWTRDSRDRVLTSTVSGPGIQPRTTIYTRDVASGRVTRLTYPDGLFEEWTYNGFGQPLTHRLRNGAVEQMTYSANGLLTQSRDAANQPTTFTYDSLDRPATVTDARGNTTAYTFNDRGQVTRITWPGTGQGFVQFSYDSFGNRLAKVDELGKIWAKAYDEFRRVTSETDPLNRTIQYEYTGDGGCCGAGGIGLTPSLITMASGKQTARGFDLEGQMLSETLGFGSPDAATTSYTYDGTGKVSAMLLPGHTVATLSTYDLVDRLATVTDPLVRVTQYTYDAAGNRLTERRADNGVTTSTYDLMERVLTTTDPKNQTVSYAYDDTLQTFTLTDARSKVTVFQSDVRGLRTSKIYSGGTHEDSTYDEVGNLKTTTTTAGKTLTLTYDARNRATFRDWSDTTPDVSATYDARGLVQTLSNANSALTFTYDNAMQLLAETQDLQAPVNLPAKTVSYTYDVDGNRASLTHPSGTVVGYGYTQRNQMASVSVDGAGLAGFGYAPDGKRTGRSLANGTGTGYDYDIADQLKAVRHLQNTNSLQRFDYTLDLVGNRTSRKESATGFQPVTDAYAYDPVDQLTEAKYTFDAPTAAHARKVTYAYDPAGNRQSMVEDADGSGPGGTVTTPYTTNDLNQYTSIDGLAAPIHDAAGNLKQVQFRLGDAAWLYQWDAQNRLIGGSNGATTFAFAYDARNRCVARTINGVTTANLYDGWTLLEERNPADALQARTIQGPGIDEPLTRTTSAGTVYYHQDALGSTTALTDSTGAVVERITYDAYGLPRFTDATGLPLANSAYGNRLLFTAREWLAELRLNDHRNRYYSPDTGRWLSRDPIEEEGGINLYGYVSNNALNFTDNNGLRPLSGFDRNSQADASPRSDNEIRKDMRNNPQEYCRPGPYGPSPEPIVSEHTRKTAQAFVAGAVVNVLKDGMSGKILTPGQAVVSAIIGGTAAAAGYQFAPSRN